MLRISLSVVYQFSTRQRLPTITRGRRWPRWRRGGRGTARIGTDFVGEASIAPAQAAAIRGDPTYNKIRGCRFTRQPLWVMLSSVSLYQNSQPICTVPSLVELRKAESVGFGVKSVAAIVTLPDASAGRELPLEWPFTMQFGELEWKWEFPRLRVPVPVQVWSTSTTSVPTKVQPNSSHNRR